MTSLVLLPGLDGTATLLSAFIECVRPTFDTVEALSYPPDQPLDYAGLESIVRQALPRSRPFVLLGESFSGPLALSIAARPPPNLTGLVLSTTFARNPVLPLRPFASLTRFAPVRRLPLPLISWWLLGQWAKPELETALHAAILAVEPAVLRARATAALRADVTDRLSQISVPVLCLHATKDRLLFPNTGRSLPSALAQASVVDIAAPHLLLQTEPAAAARAIAGFAAKLDR